MRRVLPKGKRETFCFRVCSCTSSMIFVTIYDRLKDTFRRVSFGSFNVSEFVNLWCCRKKHWFYTNIKTDSRKIDKIKSLTRQNRVSLIKPRFKEYNVSKKMRGVIMYKRDFTDKLFIRMNLLWWITKGFNRLPFLVGLTRNSTFKDSGVGLRNLVLKVPSFERFTNKSNPFKSFEIK